MTAEEKKQLRITTNKKMIGKQVFIVPKNIYGTVIDAESDDFIIRCDRGEIHKIDIFNIRQ